jgi:excisionase family DNA binding protein
MTEAPRAREPGTRPPLDGIERLGLRAAADRLGVHYMTVYRAVRNGVLPAERVGAEWVVRADDLAVSPIGTVAPAARFRSAPDWAGRLQARLRAGDTRGAWTVIEAALVGRIPAARIVTDVLAPAVAGLHAEPPEDLTESLVGATTALRLIGQLWSVTEAVAPTRGSVIIAAARHDWHDLAVMLAAETLRLAGFDVVDLGGGVAARVLGATVERRPDAVAVVLAVSVTDDAAVAAAVRAVRAASPSGPPVVVGGPGVSGPAHAAALGADAHAADVEALVACLVGWSSTDPADDAPRTPR